MDHAVLFKLEREKHMDHMVRVVPLITAFYAIQCYFITKMSPTHFSTVALCVLGVLLGAMILGFITYDIKHQVNFYADHMSCHFFQAEHKIVYNDIISIHVKDPDETFSTLKVETLHGCFSFYFVDDAQKIKLWIEERKKSELLAA